MSEKETKISRQYEVVYKSYCSNLQKAGIIMALSSILLVMILGAMWTHKPPVGWKSWFVCHLIMIPLLLSSILGMYNIAWKCINYNSGILSQIDGMYSIDNADDTFLKDVLKRNDHVKRLTKAMVVLTSISLVCLTFIVLIPSTPG